MSVHYWAPTVISPDGKPFDKKLIKVLLCLPMVNILIIVFFFIQDKLIVRVSAESVIVHLNLFKQSLQAACFVCNDNTNGTSIFLLHTHMSDSSFSVSPCWLFVSIRVAKTLSVRTFTMPSGQSGRTLWNVPKLSNRFQVLRATSQPPTITTLCVSCVIGLPAQQSAISPLKERGHNFQNGYASSCKIFP